MAKSKKRRRIIVFSAIILVLAGLTGLAFVRKREVIITVQTEKVARRNVTEIVVANGKIQPVVQVKISPEVSGEIIELPVKEGQKVNKGDLILKIKPDFYASTRNQAEAAYKGSLAGKSNTDANVKKVEAEFKRIEDLYHNKLVSDSTFDEAKAAYDMAKAQQTSSEHQVEMSRASMASAEENLAKTTIVSPLTGTISKLNSEVGERVVGTATMAGTEVMTIADLNQMEARVDIGEMDVVLIKPSQNVRLEVDAFKDRKFTGTVTEIANSSKNAGYGTGQEATKFEVRIRVKEVEAFRPGMSVTAEIETRARTNVLTVPIACVTTRMPKTKEGLGGTNVISGKTNAAGSKAKSKANPAKTNTAPENTEIAATQDTSAAALAATNAAVPADTNSLACVKTNTPGSDKKSKEGAKPVEVVFLMEKDHVKMAPVKIGICDDSYWEVTEGLHEGEEVVSGGFRAIARDLDDGKKVKKGRVGGEQDKDGERKKE